MKRLVLCAGLIPALTCTAAVQAADFSTLSPQKQTTLGLYMTPADASQWMSKAGFRTLFLDIRTREEVEFLGMSTEVDANVPYMENSEGHAWDDEKRNFKLVRNSEFAAEVARRLAVKGLAKDDPVILMCRSGDRSAMAANFLAELGYTKVYSVTEGFEGDLAKDGQHRGQPVVNGWKNAGLPWSYQLDKRKMYKLEN